MYKSLCYIKSCNLIILGANGDLSKRKLIPALYNLEKKNILNPITKIISVFRSNYNIKYYKKMLYKELKYFIKDKIDIKIWEKFSARLEICKLDLNEIKNFYKLKKKLNNKIKLNISYFAVPSNNFISICKGLNKSKINNKNSRIILEKPIGNNFNSSKKINKKILKYYQEKQIYRIDHYLGKETIINLLSLRFANSLFINNWYNKNIDHVQITVSEDIGVEGRWNYFDKVGQMRDMIQSHLLQILTIIAMSNPVNLKYSSIIDEKIKILKSLRLINLKNIKYKTVRGQYTSGIIHGKKVPGYLEENKYINNSLTETFVSIRADIDNIQWKGVPFYLRTGKRLPIKYSEIVIYFKKPSINLFKNYNNNIYQNKLIISLEPKDKITIEILNKIPDLYNKYNFKKRKINLNLIKDKKLGEYERLLLASMQGIESFFVSKDEIEESWKWIDSIINGWKILKNKCPLIPYKAGTWGPKSLDKIINRDGRFWNNMF